MIPLLKCTAPLAWPAAHSESSRVSISRCGSPAAAMRLYSAISISRMRDFASFTSARNPALCAFGAPILVHPFDARPHARQLFLDLLIAPVDVIHAVDDGLAASDQSRQHQRRAGPQIGRQHLRSGELRYAR